MLSEKSRTCLHVLRLAVAPRLHPDCGSNGIAVAFCPAEAERNRVPEILRHAVQHAELRGIPILEDKFQPPVMVQVGEHERATIVRKVQADRT